MYSSTLFFDLGTRRVCGVSVMPWTYLTPRKDVIPIVQEAGCASGMVWTGTKNPRSVQPVDSRYTDYDTQPKQLLLIVLK